MKREASAVWEGGLKDGRGTVSTQSGVLSASKYSFRDRFEDGAATNPEELVAAALASCFSMALSAALGEAGFTAQSIRTRASANFDKVAAGWSVTAIHLQVAARVPGADRAKFEAVADGAKKGCPVSRLLNTNITMEATLDG